MAEKYFSRHPGGDGPRIRSEPKVYMAKLIIEYDRMSGWVRDRFTIVIGIVGLFHRNLQDDSQPAYIRVIIHLLSTSRTSQ